MTVPAFPAYAGRRRLVMAIFAGFAVLLGARAVILQFADRAFLQNHGDARMLRTVPIPAHRGMITDRFGEPLAISTPVSSIWANPRKLFLSHKQWRQLADMLDTDVGSLKTLVDARKGKDFVYLKRQVDPDDASRVAAADLPGISIDREYRRYYPASEVAAHLLGFTNVDDQGQEGIELEYNAVLNGEPGAMRVIKDRLGRTVENVESIRAPSPGHDLALSIDKRLQYIAYRELKAAVLAHRAQAGTMVVLDAKTGEVLAMVTQPSYNPNNRADLRGEYYRNRAVTDVFEPGSALKPFTIAAALGTGAYQPDTRIETAPGFFNVGPYKVRDVHNYGTLDVTGVITKSSNVGAAKIALSLDPETLWNILNQVGFGMVTASGFPGEAMGRLTDYHNWREIDQATLAFGYGISVTALQLAKAFTVFANDGVLMPVSLLRVDHTVAGKRVISRKIAREVLAMMETVVERGTGRKAYIPGYRVAGKTGTVHKPGPQGYAENHYQAIFAGIVPATHPRLIAVVMVDDPQGAAYFGGLVAAPVFANVMQEALRLMNVPPDDPPGKGEQVYAYIPAESPDAFDDMGRRPSR